MITESKIVYSSIDEYNELKSNQWFDVVSAVLSSPVDAQDVLDACNALDSSQYFTLDGATYRVLRVEDCIDIHSNWLRDMYSGNLPPYLVVDWYETALKSLKEGGYATHFSTYDSDYQRDVEDFMIFRVA